MSIGLDLGTTSVKVLALSAGGEVLARAGGGYALYSGPTDPSGSGDVGAATQDAEEVVRVALAALDDLAGQLEGLNVHIRAIVPSAAMHSLVLIGEAGKVLAPALTWADARPSDTLPGLCAVLDARSTYERTGCPLQTPYHPARLWWLSQTHPALFAQAARFVSLTDLLLHRLTGVWATSVGLASTTGLWNLHTAAWDAPLLATLGICEAQLPAVLDAREQVGTVQRGMLAGVPVLAGSSDGALANLGTGARSGETVITVGTSGAVRRFSQAPHLDPWARTWSYRLNLETHLVGGAINNGGLLLDWVRRHWYPELEPDAGFRCLLHDAGHVAAGADGLTLLPYLTGERSPYWRSDLSATLHGLKLGHGRAQVARAALEAVAFGLAEVWELLTGTGLEGVGAVYSTGGLAQSEDWNTLIAEVFGVPVRVSEAADASATGAALLGHTDQALGQLRQQVTAAAAVVHPGRVDTGVQDAQARWNELYARLYPGE